MAESETHKFAGDAQKLLYQLVRNYEHCDRMCLGQYGVTAAQGYAILAFPDESSVTMNGLSESMGLANSTMTRMVDQLVDRGFVNRRPGDEDRREVLVGLTDEGRKTRRGLVKAQEDALRLVLEDVSGKEQRNIIAVLRLLNNAVKKVTGVCCGS